MSYRTEVKAAGAAWFLRPVGFVCFFLALPLLLPLSPALAGTGIVNSYHDFTGEAIDDGYGICAPCHQPHYSPDGRLMWSRDLTEEADYFDQDGSGTNPANYVHFGFTNPSTALAGGTLPCYDCHDDNQSGTPLVQDNPTRPDPQSWPAGEFPQNIAFEDNAANGGNPSDTGYYELQGGFVPNQGGPPVPNQPTTPPVTSPIGGHYWKGVLETTNVLDAPMEFGDKMACTICHDPHDTAATANNAVFLRETIDAGTSTPSDFDIGIALRASSASRNPGTGGDGREMCEACHYTFDYGGTLREMYGVTVPKPPDILPIDGHVSGDAEECTKCHPHNAPDCASCHGSPPRLELAPPGYVSEAAGYDNGNFDEAKGPHPRHANDLDYADPGYEFGCGFCHDTFPDQHRDGDFEDVAFDATKNPTGTYANPTCTDLYCHSRGTSINDTINSGGNTIAWTDAPDWSTSSLGCDACHGIEVATIPGAVTYGAPAYPDTPDPGAVKENCHPEHPYACSTCHYNVIRDNDPLDGWTLYDPPGPVVPSPPEPAPPSLHVSNDTTTFGYNVDPDATDPMFGSYTYDPTGGSCFNITCHGTGTAFTETKWCEDLGCEDCHLTTAADVDNWDLSDNVPSQVNETEWTTSGHGRSSGWFPWPDNYGTVNPPSFGCLTTDANEDLPLGGCHAEKVPHGMPQNPFRLATGAANNFFERPLGTIDIDSMNDFCYECHLPERETTHSQGETTGDNWGSPASAPVHFKCMDCHDPHGDSPDYMIHARVNADSSAVGAFEDYGLPSLADLGMQPAAGVIDFDVTEPNQEQTDYADLTPGGSITKICNVCHQSNLYFTRSSGTGAHNPGTDCIHCHPHNEGIRPLCEVCHSNDPNNIYLGTAPNVMGNGTSPVGVGTTPKPYDDGDWGYNVNGHGANGTAPSTPPAMPTMDRSCTPNPIDVTDPGCHDISDPPTVHLDGIYNTMWWPVAASRPGPVTNPPADYEAPGLPSSDTTNENTSHLLRGADGLLPNSPTAGDDSTAEFFDRRCTPSSAKGDSSITGCHAVDSTHRHTTTDIPLGEIAITFGDHGSTTTPKADPGSLPHWLPWTMRDHTDQQLPSAEYYGVCVSCHDPHGTNTSDMTDGSNHLLRGEWMTDPGYFCGARCH